MKSYKVVEFGQPLQKVEQANPQPKGTEVLLTAQEFLRENPGQTDERAIREAISGVICRCTGYQQIVEAIQSVAAKS